MMEFAIWIVAISHICLVFIFSHGYLQFKKINDQVKDLKFLIDTQVVARNPIPLLKTIEGKVEKVEIDLFAFKSQIDINTAAISKLDAEICAELDRAADLREYINSISKNISDVGKLLVDMDTKLTNGVSILFKSMNNMPPLLNSIEGQITKDSEDIKNKLDILYCRFIDVNTTGKPEKEKREPVKVTLKFTPEMETKILELRDLGKSFKQIAFELNTSKGVVYNAYLRLLKERV